MDKQSREVNELSKQVRRAAPRNLRNAFFMSHLCRLKQCSFRETALAQKESELAQRMDACTKLSREIDLRQKQLLISEEDLTVKTQSVGCACDRGVSHASVDDGSHSISSCRSLLARKSLNDGRPSWQIGLLSKIERPRCYRPLHPPQLLPLHRWNRALNRLAHIGHLLQ